jgi:hypothetical protein
MTKIKNLHMNVDVEIYMSNILKFFKDNPDELINLVPLTKKDEFFVKLREVAITNSEKGDEISLTRQQLIDVCLEINGNPLRIENKSNIIIPTIFGEYSLN